MTLPDLARMAPDARARLRANAERLLATGTPKQKVEARAALDALDARETSERQNLAARMSAAPLASRVAEAFRSQPPTETEAKVVQALLDHPGSTSAALTRACGWGGQTWHLHFGEMAKAREAWLWPAEPAPARDSRFFSGILAIYNEDGSTFTMRPEVVEGLAAVGIVAQRAT